METVSIRCIGKDEKIHVCEPHETKTKCGVDIRKKIHHRKMKKISTHAMSVRIESNNDFNLTHFVRKLSQC